MLTWNSRRACLVVLGASLSIWAGCHGQEEYKAPQFAASTLPSDNDLQSRIDDELIFAGRNRMLNSRDHAAWQVVHGILSYGKEMPIDDHGQVKPALDWLLEGGTLKGWQLRPGPKGVIAVLEAGSKSGQGHPDQWLGYLAQIGTPIDTKIRVAGKDYTMKDLLSQAKWDIYPGMESSWTLMGLIAYEPLDAKWTAKDGQQWTTERLVGSEAGNKMSDLYDAACGSTHRLYALTMAVNRYKAENPGKPLTGGWKKAEDRVNEAMKFAHDYQQPDGNFSTNFFQRPGSSNDVAQKLHASGHTFELMVAALPPDQLNKPWMIKAADRLCKLLNQTRDMPVECGALYHGTHGLQLYREKRFGPIKYPPMDNSAAAPVTASAPATTTAPASEHASAAQPAAKK